MMLLAFSERKEYSVIPKQKTDKETGREMFARIIEPAFKERERIIITITVWKLVKHSLNCCFLYNNGINLRSEISV